MYFQRGVSPTPLWGIFQKIGGKTSGNMDDEDLRSFSDLLGRLCLGQHSAEPGQSIFLDRPKRFLGYFLKHTDEQFRKFFVRFFRKASALGLAKPFQISFEIAFIVSLL
jgi:hypothetical protein